MLDVVGQYIVTHGVISLPPPPRYLAPKCGDLVQSLSAKSEPNLTQTTPPPDVTQKTELVGPAWEIKRVNENVSLIVRKSLQYAIHIA